MALLNYFRAYYSLYKELKVQKQYNRRFLLPYLKELEMKYGGKFSEEQREKIIKYYGLFITAFLCSSYKRLEGSSLNDAERKRATLFGILTPIGDDLFDVDGLNNEEIEKITFDPDSCTATTFSANVAKEIQTFLLRDVPDRAVYLKAAKDVLDIQKETEKQKNPDISRSELERITFSKGAYSVIIYRQILEPAANDQMLSVLYLIGSLYQFGNDLFDLFKDTRDKIFTLINTCNDFMALRDLFLERVIQQNDSIRKLPFKEKEKTEFLITINTINARSLVALDQFVKQEKKAGPAFNWQQADRKAMIVDMENPVNFMKWLFYIRKLKRL